MDKPAGRTTINRVWSVAECTEKSLTNVTASRRDVSVVCNNLSHRIVPLRLNYYLSLTVRIYNVEALVNTNE